MNWLDLVKSKYRSRAITAATIGLLGILDLSLFVIGLEPILFWFNDLLLIIGGTGLMIVVILKAMEEIGDF